MSAQTTTGKLIANLSSAYGSIGEECPILRRAAGEVRDGLRYHLNLSLLMGIRYVLAQGEFVLARNIKLVKELTSTSGHPTPDRV